MPPLIVHNVPEEERYVGEDGIKRPYAMVYPLPEGAARLKKNAPETGSFGKSSSRARSRSKTGTPVTKRQDPTIQAGDELFASYVQNQARSPERKPSASNPPTNSDAKSPTKEENHIRNIPTEVVLRGYKTSHQYAAIKTYESIAGRICEDYPRDPPVEQRRFKSDIREPAAVRQRRLTPEERLKSSRFAGGEHWIKITFESIEAADKAIEYSPQIILGHYVYAELYRGVPPRVDEAFSEQTPRREIDSGLGSPVKSRQPGFASTTPKRRRGFNHPSPSDSQTSSNTIETATLSTATISSGTVTGIPDNTPSILNRRRPSPSQTSQSSSSTLQTEPTFPHGIKPVKLLPASQALLPRPSPIRRVLTQLPLGSWLSHDIIGSQVPRTETGDFDWKNASFYWKLIYLLDFWLGFQNGDVAGRDLEYEGKD